MDGRQVLAFDPDPENYTAALIYWHQTKRYRGLEFRTVEISGEFIKNDSDDDLFRAVIVLEPGQKANLLFERSDHQLLLTLQWDGQTLFHQE